MNQSERAKILSTILVNTNVVYVMIPCVSFRAGCQRQMFPPFIITLSLEGRLCKHSLNGLHTAFVSILPSVSLLGLLSLFMAWVHLGLRVGLGLG